MNRGGFGGMLGRQLRDDLAALPESLRRRMGAEGAVERAINIEDLRRLALRRVPRAVFDYIDGAAGDELTLGRNQSELRALTVTPRVLVGGAEVDLSTTVLGEHLAIPLLGAPTGLTGIVHHEGEVALASAVHAAGGLYVLSSAGSRGIDELARLCPGPRWFQIYVSADRGVSRSLIERARVNGYKALAVTVDVPRAGHRERDRRSGFSVPPRVTARSIVEGLRRPRWSVDFLRHPRVLSQTALNAGMDADSPTSLAAMINSQFDPSLSWTDIAWVQEQWDGPIVLKGVLHPADAAQAARLGLAAVIVSNHGGRQLDGAPSAITALPAIADAVGSELEVYMDGGIRRGVDVIKAVALGARACLSARALAYGLAAGGPAGARKAMNILVEELKLAMVLAGARSLSDLDSSWIANPERSAGWSTA